MQPWRRLSVNTDAARLSWSGVQIPPFNGPFAIPFAKPVAKSLAKPVTGPVVPAPMPTPATMPVKDTGLPVSVIHKGVVDYATCWQHMRDFTDTRAENTPDQVWLVQHPAVYTLGQAGKREHILDAGDTPVINTDRGGQVTWHGPGQIVMYTLIDLRRAKLGVRELVILLEMSVVQTLAHWGIDAAGRRDAPGVYVNGAKIAALGLRVRRGCSYHGLALNVDNDLTAFTRINPCGFKNLEVTSLRQLGVDEPIADIERQLVQALSSQLAATA